MVQVNTWAKAGAGRSSGSAIPRYKLRWYILVFCITAMVKLICFGPLKRATERAANGMCRNHRARRKGPKSENKSMSVCHRSVEQCSSHHYCKYIGPINLCGLGKGNDLKVGAIYGPAKESFCILGNPIQRDCKEPSCIGRPDTGQKNSLELSFESGGPMVRTKANWKRVTVMWCRCVDDATWSTGPSRDDHTQLRVTTSTVPVLGFPILTTNTSTPPFAVLYWASWYTTAPLLTSCIGFPSAHEVSLRLSVIWLGDVSASASLS